VKVPYLIADVVDDNTIYYPIIFRYKYNDGHVNYILTETNGAEVNIETGVSGEYYQPVIYDVDAEWY